MNTISKTPSRVLSAEDRQNLIKEAFEAKNGAYSPHSHFPVGAALLTSDGTITKGASIDNASYGATMCAECTAIVKAVSEGIRSFTGLAVVGNINSTISLCGICRQVLKEFCSEDMPILLIPGDYPQKLEPKVGYTEGGVKETTLGALLPESFGPPSN
ncbi:cytidine deaminase-like protein [Gymnopilus junonius]|uniref:Cytidine deaminase n=1 Tax=Gymnopilus junonius TaxID=109634 RepID=A0A9P5TJI2_GYMJU|nr:cytidine deaminase-like protein [Gymnopilus junonius]